MQIRNSRFFRTHPVLVTLAATFIFVAALEAAGPRALPAGSLPNDVRLKPLKDLDGYFPVHAAEVEGRVGSPGRMRAAADPRGGGTVADAHQDAAQRGHSRQDRAARVHGREGLFRRARPASSSPAICIGPKNDRREKCPACCSRTGIGRTRGSRRANDDAASARNRHRRGTLRARRPQQVSVDVRRSLRGWAASSGSGTC